MQGLLSRMMGHSLRHHGLYNASRRTWAKPINPGERAGSASGAVTVGIEALPPSPGRPAQGSRQRQTSINGSPRPVQASTRVPAPLPATNRSWQLAIRIHRITSGRAGRSPAGSRSAQANFQRSPAAAVLAAALDLGANSADTVTRGRRRCRLGVRRLAEGPELVSAAEPVSIRVLSQTPCFGRISLGVDHPREACGSSGSGCRGEPVANPFYRLNALQEHGQESAGVAVADGSRHGRRPEEGLVR
jgi:hypothetical protein